MNRLPLAVLTLVLAHLSVGCSMKPPTQPGRPPGGDPPPPPLPTVTLKTFVIAGEAHLTAIGETAQLTGTATFTDDTVKDVTGETKWYIDDPSVMTVSPWGVATVLRFGFTYVYGSYQGRG